MDVNTWIQATKAIRDGLTSIQPHHREEYYRKAQAYIDELKKLDQHIKDTIATIPEDARTLITAHDAFRYFGKAYNMETIGIQGLSTQNKAEPKHIKQLSEKIKDKKISTIFAETSINERNIRDLIKKIRAKGHKVKLGGKLYSDAMGAHNPPEGTYTGMMKHNVRIITKALGGKVITDKTDLSAALQLAQINTEIQTSFKKLPKGGQTFGLDTPPSQIQKHTRRPQEEKTGDFNRPDDGQSTFGIRDVRAKEAQMHSQKQKEETKGFNRPSGQQNFGMPIVDDAQTNLHKRKNRQEEAKEFNRLNDGPNRFG